MKIFDRFLERDVRLAVNAWGMVQRQIRHGHINRLWSSSEKMCQRRTGDYTPHLESREQTRPTFAKDVSGGVFVEGMSRNCEEIKL